MADAAVEFMLENLRQLQLYHAHLIIDAKNQVEELEKDLHLFKAFLKDSTKKRRQDDSLRELFREIQDVFYEAEDIIDAFVTQAVESKSTNCFLRAFKTPVKLHRMAKDVESIGGKIRAIYGGNRSIDFASLNIGDGKPEEEEAPLVRQDSTQARLVRQDNVVGFEDEAEKLIGYLTEEAQQLDVISIIGMPGLGKTTLAWKIFHDPAIQYEFPTRIWVYVSQQVTVKEVFLAILREFTRITDDMYSISDQELAKIVCAHLESGKFLIVMDDVWAAKDWDELQIALPKRNKIGKVLITSRHVAVAWQANRDRVPHQLRFFTPEESWLLLRLEVFGKTECPSELKTPGKLIAQHCDGLPLAIVVIGGILVKRFSATEKARSNAWEEVSKNVSTYLHEDPGKRLEKIISWSYDVLPYHLRACFLYLGMFPEDFEIPVWKLIRMWIAEGFIQQKEEISLEVTAENYLDDLINRNLVKIDKMRPNGKVKTCRIHDMLRDFCKNEAGNERENFLQELKRSGEGFQPPVSNVQKYRRICIHSNVLNLLSLKPYGPRVRSFVCFSKEEMTLPTENVSAIPAAFKLLRVLDAKPIKFTKIPSDLYQLVHLRYITLSFDLKIIPAAFSKLWNLQTLIVYTKFRTLEIKADIWKMVQLRHLKMNSSATFSKKGKSSTGGEKLQTLGTISPKSCTEEVFGRAPNLKKLGIRGRLAMLLDRKNGGSFDSLGKLSNLENLKLLNDVFPRPPSEGSLPGLPPLYKFPPKLRILTLSDTYLNWSHMSILGLLENLEVLKLKDKAFIGRIWEADDGGFRHLEVLHIGRTDLVLWVAYAHHFPRLRCLELRNCEQLLDVPIGLADIPSFQQLDLYCTRPAAASARKIQKVKQKLQQEQTIKIIGFKLSISPPDE